MDHGASKMPQANVIHVIAGLAGRKMRVTSNRPCQDPEENTATPPQGGVCQLRFGPVGPTHGLLPRPCRPLLTINSNET